MPPRTRRQRREDIEDERIKRIDMLIEQERLTTEGLHALAERARARASRQLTQTAKIRQQIATRRKR
jgi:hypothetical protein